MDVSQVNLIQMARELGIDPDDIWIVPKKSESDDLMFEPFFLKVDSADSQLTNDAAKLMMSHPPEQRRATLDSYNKRLLNRVRSISEPKAY